MGRPFHILEGLSICRERPSSVLAEPLDVEEPLVWWTDCTYKDHRHAAPYKQAVGWLIPKGREGGGLSLGEAL